MPMTPFVNNDPTGVAEQLLLSGRDKLMEGWRSAEILADPITAFGAIAHLERSRFSRPGDAPILIGMAETGLPAGTPIADNITYRADVIGRNGGPGYDTDQTASPTLAERAEAQQQEAVRAATVNQSFVPGSDGWNMVQDTLEPEDGTTSLWGAAKGTSRWLFAALDIPFVNGSDAFARTIAYNDLNRTQNVDQFSHQGLGGEQGLWNQLTGEGDSLAFAVPAFAYGQDVASGQRANMGSGFFPQGQIATDVQEQVARFEQQINNLSGADWNRAKQQAQQEGDGTVYVEGVRGQRIPVRSYEEWVDVLNTAGRARIVDVSAQASPEQDVMGQAFGTYANEIFQDGVYGLDKNGNAYRATIGRVIAQEVLQMDSTTFASKAVSGVLDFGKHLMDLPLIRGTKSGLRLLGVGGNQLVGLSDEAGKLRKASDTVELIGNNADPAARGAMVTDLANGRINRDMAANSIARTQDTALQDAVRTTAEVKAKALDEGMDAAQVDDLLRRAEGGEFAAGRWFNNQLAKVHSDPVARAKQLSNWENVVARGVEPIPDSVRQADTIRNTVRQFAIDSGRSPAQVDDLIRRAENGDYAASRWLDKEIDTYADFADDIDPETAKQAWRQGIEAGTIDEQVEAIRAANEGRGVSIVDGRLGDSKAYVDDEVLGRIQADVDELDDMLRNGKASVIQGADGRPIVTFDADLSRAQETLRVLDARVGDEAVERSLAAERYLALSDRLDRLVAARRAARWTELAHVPGTRRYPTEALDEVMNTPELRAIKEELDRLEETAKALGLRTSSRGSLERAARMASDEAIESSKARFAVDMFEDVWTVRRWAEKVLGDGPEAAEQVDNLVRVLRRHATDKDLLGSADSWNKSVDPQRLVNLFNGSNGRVLQLMDEMAAADTHSQMWRVLRRTMDHIGPRGVNPMLVEALVSAKTREQVADVLVRMTKGDMFVSNRVRLLGDWATKGGAITTATQLGGAIGGGYHAATQEDASLSDIIGSALVGGFAGRRIGSMGVGSTALAANVFRKGTALSRNVDDVADMMDVMLAGSRSATANNLLTMERMRGRLPGTQPAQLDGARWDQLSRPHQFSAAFGHTPFGRALAREASHKMSLNDPSDMYHKLRDYARNYGLRGDERIVSFKRLVTKVNDQGEEYVERVTERLISTNYRSADEMQDAVERLVVDGWEVVDDVEMDRVFGRVATMQPNNTAQGWSVLTDFMKGVDGLLADAGLPDDLRRIATRFATEGSDEFIANVDAAGTPIALQQMAVNGRVVDVSDAPLLTAEMWAGNINLPPSDVMRRVMAQTHGVGKVMDVFSGAGLWGPRDGQVWEALGKHLRGEEVESLREVLRPGFERNVAARVTRQLVGGLQVPLVLLTRPIAFLSRVLLDDQMRMVAGGLGQWTPTSILGWMVGNWTAWKRRLGGQAGRYGVRYRSARSVLPPELFDPSIGKIDADALDDMSIWDLEDEVMRELRIYDRSAGERSTLVFGAAQWGTKQRGTPGYIEGLVREYRQMLRDPMTSRMAQSSKTTVQDVVDDVYEWLTTTDEGAEVMLEWGKQFRTAEDARLFMEGDNLKAFLADQYARLHLKTGGDWIYKKPDGTVLGSSGSKSVTLDAADYADYPVGYTVIRRGDPEMLDAVATRQIGGRSAFGDGEGIRIGASVGDEAQEAIERFVRQRHDHFEAQVEAAIKNGDNVMNVHRFPDAVKGLDQDTVDMSKIRGLWERGLEVMYDFFLGAPSKYISRIPTLGTHYWERVGMLMPQMSDEVAEAWMQVARREGKDIADHVERIARGFDEAGMSTKTIDEFDFVDEQAKAYAVTKLNDTLFDLHRQRNIIDTIRVLAPFAGPMVEAFENWARVLRRRPVTVWRRGLQAYNALWDTSPIAQDNSDKPFGSDLWVMGGGGFYTDRETGDPMMRYPWSGPITKWVNEQSWGEGVSPDGVNARLRGFNVVFGPDDFSDPETNRIPGIGVPATAFNPGLSIHVQMAVGSLLRDKEGFAAEVYESLFEYGEGEPLQMELAPYHLQRLMQGVDFLRPFLSDEGREAWIASVNRQWEHMGATGVIGDGPDAEYNINDPADIEASMEEAKQRASHEAIFEFIARGFVTPTMTTPKQVVTVEGIDYETGLVIDKFKPLVDLAMEARELMTEEGADWVQTEDGYMVSTEGDYEVTRQYLNRKYGMDLFAAEWLNIPVTSTQYPRIATDYGLQWMKDNEGKISEPIRSSGWLLMPDIAMADQEQQTDFSFEARDYLMERGDIRFVGDLTEMQQGVQATLLDAQYRQIDREAIRLFGPDDAIEGDEQDRKDQWVRDQKDVAFARWERSDVNASQTQKVLDELLAWDQVDWDAMDLPPEERATVDAVLWYLDLRSQAVDLARRRGIDDITLKGDGADDQEFMETLRDDINNGVNAQVERAQQTGMDLGNFVYVYERYLSSEIDRTPEFDALEALAAIREGSWQYVGVEGP